MKKPVRNRFTEAYEKEVTPARIRKFHQDVAKLKTCPEKLKFARNEKVKYLQYISAETLDVSGSTALPNFEKGTPLFFDRIIQLEINKLEAECGNAKKTRELNDCIAGKALFCSLINMAGIQKKGQTESTKDFCERVCKKYSLKYSDTIRRRFQWEPHIVGKHADNAAILEMTEAILPNIDKTTADKIRQLIIDKNSKGYY